MRGKDGMWGGPLEILQTGAESPTDHEDENNYNEFDRAAYRAPSDEVKQGWLLKPADHHEKAAADHEMDDQKKKMMMMRRLKMLCINSAKVYIRSVVVVGILVGLITVIYVKMLAPRRHHLHQSLPPDNYTTALHQALIFFNAQRSGRLPRDNNVSWRGDSCLSDHGNSESETNIRNLVGGYYDAGDASKLSFPTSFAMTMLSWSVIEYSAKFAAIGELDHIKDIIKWGTDYLLNTFNSSAEYSIGHVVADVRGSSGQDQCWIRPEDIDHPRMGQECYKCSALAAEMASALASASIVFKDSITYSKKLLHAAHLLFKFATKDYPLSPSPTYNKSPSTALSWDEFLWGGSWLYLATGNLSYLQLVTNPDLASWTDPESRVFSLDNKHAGAFLLLTRLRLFLSYGYPFEEMLSKFHSQIEEIMCSYLPFFPSFKTTKGGLIMLNNGRPRPLHYVVYAAFLAQLFSDYMDAISAPGWYCGHKFYSNQVVRKFAGTQIDYILGRNPEGMSYVVGFGEHFPQKVHHRGASIPNNNIKYGCKGGLKWRDSEKPNPNTIVGAMVGGPDKYDNFQDVRYNYNYTEPSLAGNAGLVAALVALSTGSIDKNSMFYAVPPLTSPSPPPPSPWIP